MQSSHNSSTPKIFGALAIFAVTASGAYYFLFKDVSNSQPSTATITTSTNNTQSDDEDTTNTTASTVASTTSQSSVAANNATNSSGYKDGTYTATAQYYVPHGSNDITVKVTIKDGVITAIDDSNNYADRESAAYINSFNQTISGKVVGKALSSVASLSRVGGASLTTEGFDTAIQDIMSQAQA